MKDILEKRKEELKNEFDQLNQERTAMLTKLQEMELRMNELHGAYGELEKLIKESDDNKG